MVLATDFLQIVTPMVIFRKRKEGKVGVSRRERGGVKFGLIGL